MQTTQQLNHELITIKARELYLNGKSLNEIAKIYQVEPSTVFKWKERYKWNEQISPTLTKIDANTEQIRLKRILEQQTEIEFLYKHFFKQMREKIKLNPDYEINANIILKLLELDNKYTQPKEESDNTNDILNAVSDAIINIPK